MRQRAAAARARERQLPDPAGRADPERRAEIVKVLGDDKIAVAPAGDPGMQSPPSALSARIMGPVRAIAAEIWPGVSIVPTMATGATDGRFLNAHGTPTYGLSGMFHDAEGPRAHGLNERIRVVSLMNGRRFLYEVVKLLRESALISPAARICRD